MASTSQGPEHVLPSRVLVEQPGGELELGTDYERVPKAVPRPSHGHQDDVESSFSERESIAREREAARQQARQYQAHVLRKRRRLFLVALGVDFLFFTGVLVYQVVRAPNGGGLRRFTTPSPAPPYISQNGTIVSSGNISDFTTPFPGATYAAERATIPVTWFVPVDSLKLEDVVFSLVLDLLGVVGALHSRTTVLSLFILLEALCTALITLAGLSLLQVFRVLLIGAAFFLRAAIITSAALMEAAGLIPQPVLQVTGPRGLLVAAQQSARGLLGRLRRGSHGGGGSSGAAPAAPAQGADAGGAPAAAADSSDAATRGSGSAGSGGGGGGGGGRQRAGPPASSSAQPGRGFLPPGGRRAGSDSSPQGQRPWLPRSLSDHSPQRLPPDVYALQLVPSSIVVPSSNGMPAALLPMPPGSAPTPLLQQQLNQIAESAMAIRMMNLSNRYAGTGNRVATATSFDLPPTGAAAPGHNAGGSSARNL